jgi:exonuclease III
MKEYLKHFNTIKPVIWTGDLNVGHLDLDIYNHDAKHIVKQAGLTPQERNSFSSLLQETSFIDAFRHFHPSKLPYFSSTNPMCLHGFKLDAKGQFTYWSQRTFARPVNCGIRLDYFICSPSLFPSATASNDGKVPAIRVHDSYILHQDTVGASDHCPVILVLATDSD